MSRTFRYVPYMITHDPLACTEVSAVCVSGDDTECGEKSSVYLRPDSVIEWMRQHAQETGHRRYRRSYGHYLLLEPPDDFTGATVIGQVTHRALPPGDGAA
ncbi:hypothetical protein ACFU99_03375 [Streptomyces sp. NPDC057654]|uniref:DUF7848 domain-containing protein n=1 Tax=Streptomyces sp. NPDC057654 TaxID=3346196 RepID=UPI00369EABC8